jgi:hypothetical protein
MAQTTTISQKELERIAGLAYEGETLKVMLCSVGVTGYTANSTVANWQSVEKSGNGYVRYSAAIGTGAWNGTALAYVMPDIDAAFTCSGTSYSYDTVVIYIDGATYPHSIITESPNIALAVGQTQTYRISLRTDD